VLALDRERGELLGRVPDRLAPTGVALLREIAGLNDRAIGVLEHQRRALERDWSTVEQGGRAVRAYSATNGERRA
jgi:hypothetical protein